MSASRVAAHLLATHLPRTRLGHGVHRAPRALTGAAGQLVFPPRSAARPPSELDASHTFVMFTKELPGLAIA